MKFIFTNILSPRQLSDIMSVYSHQEVVSIQQYPGFVQIIEPDVSLKYLLAYRGEELAGYACVKVKKRILATVYFGPLVNDPGDYEELCAAVVSACVRRCIFIVKILPPYMAPEREAAIASFTRIQFEQSDEYFNWGTLKLPLDKKIEDIFKGFSDNHRQSIKKAQKHNLTVDVITNPAEVDIFAEQFIIMYKSRGLPISQGQIRNTLKRLFTFYQEHKSGFFLVVKSPEDGIIGGVCINYQGDSGFYQMGYSHPHHRTLPINHLAIYEAIRISKENGCKVFDFGGYGLNLKEGDQVHAINRFKSWFGGQLVYHPKTLIIYSTKLLKFIYKKFQ
jgi:hypothetical protein